MKCSSIGNLRDKKGKFTSRKQLANGESSISCSCFFLLRGHPERSYLIYLYGRKISMWIRCHVMNLCASSQWEMIYLLVLCCYKIGACVLSYGWSCFRKTSGLFDCIFVQSLGNGNFCTGWGKSFLQCEFIGSRWITLKWSWWIYCWNIISSGQFVEGTFWNIF